MIYPHRFDLQAQFEDVDAGGAVYHPNYLNYLERGRSQLLRDLGIPFKEILERGLAVVVAEVNSKYLKPIFLDDRVSVFSWFVRIGGASLYSRQAIVRGLDAGAHLVIEDVERHPFLIHTCDIRLVSVDLKSMKPTPIPRDVGDALKKYLFVDDVTVG